MKLALLLLLLQIPTISKYLSYTEAVKTTVSVGSTPSASVNKPNSRQLALLQRFGREYFDPLRLHVGSPLYPSSVFRSVAVNTKVGGAKNSEHMILDDVVACDIDQDVRGKVGNRALFFIIKERGGYRKLIWEFGTAPSQKYINSQGVTKTRFGAPAWCHVSWSPDKTKNIEKVYRATKSGKRTVYTLF